MHGVVRMIARSQMRRRWRAVVALTLFVGLAGGVAMALVAGARRSATVVDRFAATARRYDASVYLPDDATAASWPRATMRALPGVVRADPAAYMALNARPRSGGSMAGVNGNVGTWTALDPTTRLLAGRIPDGSDPNEILVNQAFVDQFGYSVGDTVPVRMFGLDQGDEVSQGIYDPAGPRYRLRLAGVVRVPAEIATGSARAVGSSGYGSTNVVLVSNEFYERHAREFLGFGLGYNLVLRDGAAGTAALTEALAARTPTGEDPPQVIPPLFRIDTGSIDAPVQLETTALLLLGIGLGLAGAIATALIVRAEQRACDDNTPTLRSLGCSVPQLAGAAALRIAPAALGGTVIAIAVAVALSARFPIGIGRLVELDPGTQGNLVVLGLGALVMVAFVLGCALVLGRPRRDPHVAPTRHRGVASWLGRVGAPVDPTIAAHLSFDRARGARGVPSRSAIVGGATLLAVLTGVGVYVGGVDHLYGNRAAHGFAWDAVIGNTNFPFDPDTADALANDPRITALTAAADGQARVNGVVEELVAFDPAGTAPPTVIAGRLPRRDDELALGAGTQRRLGVHLGDRVTFSVRSGEYDTTGAPTTARTMTVVGTALAAVEGDSDLDHIGLVTFAGIEAAGGGATPQLALVRLRDGSSTESLAAIDRSYTEEIATDLVGARIVNLHRVRGVPLLGIVAAALMGIFVLVYVLAVSVRARKREHAVLRALGLPVRRLRRVLAWQGAILATGIVAFGLPVGLLLGAALWRRAAAGIGVRPDVALSPWLLLIAPSVLAIAVAASVVPARRAGREQITQLLRAE